MQELSVKNVIFPVKFQLGFGFVTYCKNLILRHREGLQKAKYLHDLERLALGAPHMLPDIGFELDKGSSSHAKQLWRRGEVSIEIQPGDKKIVITSG